MQQYRKLVETILEKGTYKGPAREGMPGSLSYFGYQFRHNLAEGFPLLTTKKVNFKKVVVELLWFLRGDANIKYLNDNGCDIWNEDAYNYYVKVLERQGMYPVTYKDFVDAVVTGKTLKDMVSVHSGYPTNYELGDCGMQYGKLWRDWGARFFPGNGKDQIKDLIEGLKKNPEGRRHILTAWNPATLDQMALNACHALVQFNCRRISDYERAQLYHNKKTINYEFKAVIGHCVYPDDYIPIDEWDVPDPIGYEVTEEEHRFLDKQGIPQYYLDCQMYQRSADMFLGVPFNIASYSLLTLLLAEICNMIPGDFIHTFGDAHIYDNHRDAINLQMSREERALPTVKLFERSESSTLPDHYEKFITGRYELSDFLLSLTPEDFKLQGYDPHPYIKAELSTGLINKK